MKYIAINELSYFEFHDAKITRIEFDNRYMLWEVSAVNATTKCTHNNFEDDMCIDEAVVVFEDACIESIVYCAYVIHDSTGGLIESREAITADPSEYTAILENTCSHYCYIYSMEELPADGAQQYRACFNIDGGAGNYYITIVFAKSIVKWNEFSGLAWYESEKWKKLRNQKAEQQ